MQFGMQDLFVCVYVNALFLCMNILKNTHENKALRGQIILLYLFQKNLL